MAGLRFEKAAHHIVLEDCIAAVEAAWPDWSLAPVVRALQALRGMALVAAATLVAELGDITRFANPCQLTAYLGPVPSEHSSGAARRQGGITKAGKRRSTYTRSHPKLSKAGGAVTARRTSTPHSRRSSDAGR